VKITWKSELPSLLCLAAMFTLLAATWSSAPGRVPVHWDIRGEIDRYGTKVEGLLILPATAVVIYLLLRFLPLIDPHRANYERFATAYGVIRHGAVALLAVLYGLTIAIVRGAAIDMTVAVSSTLGLFFVATGAVMPTLRPNWFFGIRTPWTLSSELAWTRAHRVAGWVFIAAGLAIAAAGWIRTTASVIVFLAIVIVGILASTWVSYLAWRDDPHREKSLRS